MAARCMYPPLKLVPTKFNFEGPTIVFREKGRPQVILDCNVVETLCTYMREQLVLILTFVCLTS